ncbi:MAG TPA: hypothetical protein VHZ09_16080 [Acidobacteriaceae bacterium]|jgi:uncharacterized membrane protein|nr:hypothetical protein [Acidobacteriaceae bacterium]
MNYAIPILLLIATIVAFFAVARGCYSSFGIPQLLLRILVAIPLPVSAVLVHFMRPDVAAAIIPPAFPDHRFFVLFTGVCEIAGSIGLFVPATRRHAAFWIAVMMVAIFPANVYAAGKVIDGLRLPGVPLRTAMQIVYILLILLAGYGIPGRSPASRVSRSSSA